MVEAVVAALDRHAGLEVRDAAAFDRFGRIGGHARQRHPVLRPLWACQRGLDRAHIELQGVGEDRVRAVVLPPHALGLGIGLDQRHPVGIAAGEGEVVQGFLVDGEEAAGRAVLRRHVGDRRPVGQGHGREAGAVELDELSDHAPLAQHLGHGQHQVGRRGAFLEPAGQLEADDLGDQHGDGLAKHRRLGLDAADAPAQHGQSIDHGGVAVGAHESVGVGDGAPLFLGRPNGLRQVLQVDLMANACARRHHTEVVEGGLPPAQESIALPVALELQLDVFLEGVLAAEIVDHHRVVDHQVDRRKRIDLLGVSAQLPHGLAHRGEIDHRRDAGEVLHQDPRRAIGDFLVAAPFLLPVRHGLDVVDGDAAPVLVAQQVFQQHLQRVRQARDIADLAGRRLQAEVVVVLAGHGKRTAGFEAVLS